MNIEIVNAGLSEQEVKEYRNRLDMFSAALLSNSDFSEELYRPHDAERVLSMVADRAIRMIRLIDDIAEKAKEAP